MFNFFCHPVDYFFLLLYFTADDLISFRFCYHFLLHLVLSDLYYLSRGGLFCPLDV